MDAKPKPAPRPGDRNTVFIGNKPPMNYVMAVITQFAAGSAKVTIRARGKAISQAVDVAEIVRNKFYPNATVAHVGIATEQVTNDEGRRRSVSAIEIQLSNPEGAAAPKASATPTAASHSPPA